ncbi:hypothetical protein GY45DRAFT_582753 [Cubamyces sp. BRFM 1775]|nr:hypothetical protein GY45DRAFT_582753 [Cubamyces sp. BRFM 1775]
MHIARPRGRAFQKRPGGRSTPRRRALCVPVPCALETVSVDGRPLPDQFTRNVEKLGFRECFTHAESGNLPRAENAPFVVMSSEASLTCCLNALGLLARSGGGCLTLQPNTRDTDCRVSSLDGGPWCVFRDVHHRARV